MGGWAGPVQLVGWCGCKKCCYSHYPFLLHVMDPRQHTASPGGGLLHYNKRVFLKIYTNFFWLVDGWTDEWMNVDESIIVS